MTPPLRVVLAGARGRMGRVARRALAAEAAAGTPGQQTLLLSAELHREDSPADVLEPEAHDVLLDFSPAAGSRVHAPLAAERGIAPVVGSSGLSADDIERLRHACGVGGVGGLLIPNFSVGAVLQMQAAERIAAFLECTGIREIHHPQKLDSPSGTARSTAERIERGASGAGRDTRPPQIQSERVQGVLARQVVRFGSAHEQLVLDHDVRDREAYAPGILLAIRAVAGLRELRIGLDSLLNDALAPPG